MSDEQLLKPVSVRFPQGTKNRLAAVSKRFKLNESEIVRRALEQKLPEWEKTNELIIEGDK